MSPDNREFESLEAVKDNIRKKSEGVINTIYTGVLIQYNFDSGLVTLVKEKLGDVEITYQEGLFTDHLRQIKSAIELMAKEKLLIWMFTQGDERICDVIRKHHDVDVANQTLSNKSKHTAQDTLSLVYKELKPPAISKLFQQADMKNPSRQILFSILSEVGIKNIQNGNDVNVIISRVNAAFSLSVSKPKP